MALLLTQDPAQALMMTCSLSLSPAKLIHFEESAKEEEVAAF